MIGHAVWGSSSRSQIDMLQTKPIWRLPSLGLASHAWEGGNIFRSSTAATSSAQPSRCLLNKPQPGESKGYGSILVLQRETRANAGREQSWRAKWEWEGIIGHLVNYMSVVRGESVAVQTNIKGRFNWVDPFCKRWHLLPLKGNGKLQKNRGKPFNVRKVPFAPFFKCIWALPLTRQSVVSQSFPSIQLAKTMTN